jgi:hypothetical protein
VYLTGLEPIQWLTADLKRAALRRLDGGRPVIVDGILVLEVLDQIGRKADFPGEGGRGSIAPPEGMPGSNPSAMIAFDTPPVGHRAAGTPS